MAAFSGTTLKPLKLVGNRQSSLALARPRRASPICNSIGVVRSGENARGQRVISGGPALKSTQAYTEEFGSVVCAMYLELEHGHMYASVDLEDRLDEPYESAEDAFSLAHLSEVLRFASE